MDRWTWMMAATVTLALVGCPSDDVPGDDSGSSSGGETTSTTSDSGTSLGTTSAGSDSMSGTTETTTGTSTTDGTTAGPGTDGTSSGGTGTGGSTGGRVDPCAELGREACVGDDNCEPIVCVPYETMGDGFCLGSEAFIGCRSADIVCAEVRTTTCEANDATVYACVNACIPDAWMECAAPTDGMVNMCPGNGGGG